MRRTSNRNEAFAISVGPPAALAVAGLLGAYRDDVRQANVALMLVIVVILAALATRLAGFVTAAVAALAYNYFHTVPYQSLRIDAWGDVLTVALLMVVGVVVAEIGEWRRRIDATATRRLEGARALEHVIAELASGRSSDEVWPEVRAGIVGAMRLADCRYEPGSTTDVAVLPRTGAIVTPSMRLGLFGFELPVGGAAIPVADGASTLGHIVLVPSGQGSPLDARQVAVALADIFAIALSKQLSGPRRDRLA